MSVKLDKVLTIPEVAAIAGWQRRRMLRHLLRLNSEVGGMLLHNIGTKARPRWTVTLAAMKAVAPAWFSDDESVATRLEALEGEVKQLRRLLVATNETVAQLVA